MRARYGRRERTVRRERADAQSRSTRPARLTRGGGERDSKGLSLLVLALLGGGRVVFLLGLGHALLELLHARAEGLGELRQPVRPEEDEDDDQDHQQFLIAQTKHWGTPFGACNLSAPLPPAQDTSLTHTGGDAAAIEVLQQRDGILARDPQQILDVARSDVLSLAQERDELFLDGVEGRGVKEERLLHADQPSTIQQDLEQFMLLPALETRPPDGLIRARGSGPGLAEVLLDLPKGPLLRLG